MRTLFAFGAIIASIVAVYACGGRTNASTPDAGVGDAAIVEVDAAAIGPCGPFSDPDAAAARCSPAERAKRLAFANQQPIVPPFRAAGIDLRGPHGIGLTQPELDAVLCTPDTDSPVVLLITGADAGPERRALVLYTGYTGSMDFASADRQHSYRIAIGSPITRDGQPFAIDWFSTSHTDITELYRAALSTFAPDGPAPTATCEDLTGSVGMDVDGGVQSDCVVGFFGGVTYFYFRSIGFAAWFPNKEAAQPEASTPNRIDLDAPHMPCDP